MIVEPTSLPEVLLIRPKVFVDSRGSFMEAYNQQSFEQKTGIKTTFVQDNQSESNQFVLRGLHYQISRPQAKLIRVLDGQIFDVAVDIRRSSKTFGRWVGVNLSSSMNDQLYIPAGFAHGFFVLSEKATVLYKISDFYFPEGERTILWNDPSIGIRWPISPSQKVTVSEKDLQGTELRHAEIFL